MSRSYRLLCPIARSLDRVGDRWTLLMLRDLHAGPMRFGDFLSGLPGAASNLVASRLQKLQADGLVLQTGQHYALTELGRRTERVLWELARLGTHFEPGEELKTPAHLRLIAVPLQNALRRVVDSNTEFVAAMVLDGDPFSIDIRQGQVEVRYGLPANPAVVVTTSYEPMMAAASGELALDRYVQNHVHIEGPDDAATVFGTLMARVLTEGFA